MKVKEESEKAGLKFSIPKTKIMTFSPITSWQINGETVERVTDFIFLASKITADGDCSHEIKRHLLLGRKDMTNLDSILKSRDITLPTKVHLVKAIVFPVVVYGCESWTVKKAEHQRIDAFKLWCCRRLLRVPWTTRSNQSILKKISPFYFVPLIYISVFVPVPCCLDDCGFVVDPEVRQVDSTSSILLSQDCFDIRGFLLFPYKL